ncbi:MAG: glutathione transporter permease GsiD [candidate division NC10 bacterium]|jgi:peptide/nickel transport system permease protein|nr:glutathione transporter permease GsiD [candidate division NC10 bacterium]
MSEPAVIRSLPSLRDRLRRYGQIVIAIPLLAVLAIGAVGAPVLVGHDPNRLNVRAKAESPSITHLLGTDEFGRDILSRLAYGARITLLVAAASVLLAAAGGTLLGSVAAYAGRGVETVIMRTMDGMLCFPPILLAIFVVTFLGPSIVNLILVIGVLYIPRFTRVVHSSTLAIRELEYVESARALGASAVRIIGRAILPNILAPIFVQASLAAGHAILMESGLSFLGLGPPPPAPSWGRMVEQSGRFMQLSLLPILWPSAAISVTVLAFNLLGDGLRDLLDPRLRNR